MKRILCLLALCLTLPVRAAKPASPLDPLAKRYAVKREALVKEFAAKRKAMTTAAGWSALPEEQRKARLTELASQFAERDAKLTADYDAARARLTGQESAVDQTKRQQTQRQDLDRIRAQAAQDAARHKP